MGMCKVSESDVHRHATSILGQSQSTRWIAIHELVQAVLDCLGLKPLEFCTDVCCLTSGFRGRDFTLVAFSLGLDHHRSSPGRTSGASAARTAPTRRLLVGQAVFGHLRVAQGCFQTLL